MASANAKGSCAADLLFLTSVELKNEVTAERLLNSVDYK